MTPMYKLCDDSDSDHDHDVPAERAPYMDPSRDYHQRDPYEDHGRPGPSQDSTQVWDDNKNKDDSDMSDVDEESLDHLYRTHGMRQRNQSPEFEPPWKRSSEPPWKRASDDPPWKRSSDDPPWKRSSDDPPWKRSSRTSVSEQQRERSYSPVEFDPRWDGPASSQQNLQTRESSGRSVHTSQQFDRNQSRSMSPSSRRSRSPESNQHPPPRRDQHLRRQNSSDSDHDSVLMDIVRENSEEREDADKGLNNFTVSYDYHRRQHL